MYPVKYVFVKIMFMNTLNMGFPLRGSVEKTVNEEEKSDSRVKKKFLTQVSVKKVILTVF